MNGLELIGLDYIDTHKATIRAVDEYEEMKRLRKILCAGGLPLEKQNCVQAKKAMEFLEWFEPAWERLDDEDSTGAKCHENEAISHLAKLLYGCDNSFTKK